MRYPMITFIKKNKLAAVAAFFVLVVVGAAVLGPLIYPYDPTAIDLDSIKVAPSIKHPCGTDSKGRDNLAHHGRLRHRE